MADDTNAIWVTTEVRTSFLHLFQARPNKKREGKLFFDGNLIFPKNTDFSTLRAIADKVCLAAFGNTAHPRALFPGDIAGYGGLRPFFLDGDVLAAAKPDTYAAYRGNWALSFLSPENRPIPCKDANRQPIINPDDLQSGDYVMVSFEVSAYTSSKHGACLSIKPKVIKKTRNGEHFGGGIPTKEAEDALYGGGTPQNTGGNTQGSSGSLM